MYPALAIDCSDQVCSVAISDGTNSWQLEEEGNRQQARKILSLVENCLNKADISKQQLQSICWAAGPGSFTGLRIATAVAQGLAYALNLPLTPTSSLEAMAAAASSATPLEKGGKLLAITDARMGEYYWAFFEVDSKGEMTRLSEDSLSSIELITCASNLNLDLALIVGSGAEAFESSAPKIGKSINRASDLFSLAEEGKQINAREAEPVYLRSKSAWKTLEQQ
jgi:tRNA threonylcarbamoyladenosine biosynthesis protein TsaB